MASWKKPRLEKRYTTKRKGGFRGVWWVGVVQKCPTESGKILDIQSLFTIVFSCLVGRSQNLVGTICWRIPLRMVTYAKRRLAPKRFLKHRSARLSRRNVSGEKVRISSRRNLPRELLSPSACWLSVCYLEKVRISEVWHFKNPLTTRIITLNIYFAVYLSFCHFVFLLFLRDSFWKRPGIFVLLGLLGTCRCGTGYWHDSNLHRLPSLRHGRIQSFGWNRNHVPWSALETCGCFQK